MPLSMKVGLGLGHIVLDGDPAPKGAQPPPHFLPMSIVAKWSPISATAEHLFLDFIFVLGVLAQLMSMYVHYSIHMNVCCRTSVRQIAVYDVADLSSFLYKIDLNTSPSILIPYYDEDSSVIFATGRVSIIIVTRVSLKR